MGAVCGKEKPENFSGPGRRLDSAPEPPTTAPVPKRASPKVGGPPRVLGGSSGGGDDRDKDLQRQRAAEAAEARAQATNKSTGKLGRQLSAQRKQTVSDTLHQASTEERRRREIENAEARYYN